MRKIFGDRIVAMHNEYMRRLLLEMIDPVQKTVHICMSADSGKDCDAGIYFNIFTKKFYTIRTFYQFASKRSYSLISYKKNGTFSSPEIVLQMMADSSGFTHTGSGKDDLWLLVEVDHS